MSKQADITTIASGFYSTSALNNNFDAINLALDNTLSLDGSTPNSLTADFDMNGYGILNASGIFINGTDVFSLLNRVTVSTEAPSGGSDGDMWFRVTA